MIPVYEISVNEKLTTEKLGDIIADYLTNRVQRMVKLEKYFLGKNDINQRVMADPLKPNNKIANGYANNIVNTITGYFMGNPVAYQFRTEDANEELFRNILKNNNENRENSSLAQDASVFGFGAEIVYINEKAEISFDRMNPIGTIMIVDNSVSHKLKYVVKLDKVDTMPFLNYDDKYTATVYDNTFETVYNYNNKVITLIGEREHMMRDIPVVIYKNNSEMMGDFEIVISLIDAYDKLESDSLNDYEAFVDSYMVLQGMDLTAEEAAAMRENRILLLPEGGNASWLTKAQQDAYQENLKNRLDKDIYKFANVVNMSDENFANNLSGIAIQYKLMGTENKCATKQNFFDEGLRTRAGLINNITTMFNSPIVLEEMTIIFSRNLPTNYADLAGIVNQLSSLVSKETLLGLLPFVEDVSAEMERKGEESEAAMAQFFEPTIEDDNEEEV